MIFYREIQCYPLAMQGLSVTDFVGFCHEKQIIYVTEHNESQQN